MTASARRTIVVTTKNEGPFLLEWVAYHRLIGFDNPVVFSNNCEDGSDRLLDAMDAAGLIRHYDNTDAPAGLPGDPQNRAYRRAFAMDHVAGSDWVLVVDADEFLNIHVGDGTLDALFDAMGPADVISGTWRIFGNGGRIAYADDLITAQFTRAAPTDVQVSFRHFGLKSMFRPRFVHRLGIHRPFLKGEFKKPDSAITWRNGSGQDVTRHYREKGWSASMATKGYDLCQINHYMIKSNELFLMKRYRGTANSVDKDRINFSYYDDFNSNHDHDSSMARWSDRIRAEVARLRAAHPDIAAGHDACVAFFRAKIAALAGGLEKSDPEVFDKLLNPATVAAQIAADEAWLSVARATGKPPQKPVEPVAEPDPVPEDAADDPSGAAPAPAAPDPDRAPDWLADLRRSPHRQGFYHSDDRFAAHFARRDPDRLVISFDNLSNVNDPALSRESWGYGFYRGEGWSHLGVLSFAANWYRDEALFDWFEEKARVGFFARFRSVMLTGTSMGAYAATAFARLIPGCTVLAFSPQSTLAADLVPWERRFGTGRAQDWTGRYRDGAEGLDRAGRVHILYDPGFAPDRRHAERYRSPTVVPLKTWYTHHKSALFLRRAEILKPVVRLAMDGALTAEAFYGLYRARRKLPWYVNGLADQALAAGHRTLVDAMSDSLIDKGRAPLGRAIKARLKSQE